MGVTKISCKGCHPKGKSWNNNSGHHGGAGKVYIIGRKKHGENASVMAVSRLQNWTDSVKKMYNNI